MKRSYLVLLTLTLGGLTLLPSLEAHHSASCPSWTQYYDLVDSDAGPFYVANDGILSNGVTFSVWVYQESNGVSGLQRHDDYCSTPGYESSSLSDTVVI